MCWLAFGSTHKKPIPALFFGFGTEQITMEGSHFNAHDIFLMGTTGNQKPPIKNISKVLKSTSGNLQASNLHFYIFCALESLYLM